MGAAQSTCCAASAGKEEDLRDYGVVPVVEPESGPAPLWHQEVLSRQPSLWLEEVTQKEAQQTAEQAAAEAPAQEVAEVSDTASSAGDAKQPPQAAETPPPEAPASPVGDRKKRPPEAGELSPKATPRAPRATSSSSKKEKTDATEKAEKAAKAEKSEATKGEKAEKDVPEEVRSRAGSDAGTATGSIAGRSDVPEAKGGEEPAATTTTTTTTPPPPAAPVATAEAPKADKADGKKKDKESRPKKTSGEPSAEAGAVDAVGQKQAAAADAKGSDKFAKQAKKKKSRDDLGTAPSEQDKEQEKDAAKGRPVAEPQASGSAAAETPRRLRSESRPTATFEQDLKKRQQAWSQKPAKEQEKEGGQLRAAAKAGDLAAVTLALEAGIAPDAVDGDGWTALILAAEAGKQDVVELLLKYGANAKAQIRLGEWGNSALHMAARQGHRSIAELLAGRSDLQAKNYKGKVAWEVAKDAGDKDLAKWLKKQEKK